MNPRPNTEGRDVGSMPTSRAVVALTGASYLCVGLAFSYLDRRHGLFGVQGVLWLIWALAGFGAGTLYVGRPASVGKTHWNVQGWLGFSIAIFPCFLMFNMLRWISVALMLIIGARAVMLRTRRDFYLTLTCIFVVSFVVGTHRNADWTLWFYLGPAWLLAGLALAWDHAAGTPISRWIKALMTVGFIFTSVVLALALFLFAPRPAVLGFGFLPPGTDTPGLFNQPADGDTPTKGNAESSAGSGLSSGASGASLDADATESGQAQQWGQMLKNMRSTLSDSFIPQWQRNFIEGMLNGAQSLLNALTGTASDSAAMSDQASQAQAQAQAQQDSAFSFWDFLVWLLLFLLAGLIFWRKRYRIGLFLALSGSWALAFYSPAWSMRFSAQALKWCLHLHGHRPTAGQSVREQWASAVGLPPLAQRWLGYAVEIYCETRFGDVPATPQRARHMRETVHAASDVMTGLLVPELSRT